MLSLICSGGVFDIFSMKVLQVLLVDTFSSLISGATEPEIKEEKVWLV